MCLRVASCAACVSCVATPRGGSAAGLFLRLKRRLRNIIRTLPSLPVYHADWLVGASIPGREGRSSRSSARIRERGPSGLEGPVLRSTGSALVAWLSRSRMRIRLAWTSSASCWRRLSGVVQIARNLLEGAAAVTRAQQLRSYGVPVPQSAFHFVPRPLQ